MLVAEKIKISFLLTQCNISYAEHKFLFNLGNSPTPRQTARIDHIWERRRLKGIRPLYDETASNEAARALYDEVCEYER